MMLENLRVPGNSPGDPGQHGSSSHHRLDDHSMEMDKYGEIMEQPDTPTDVPDIPL